MNRRGFFGALTALVAAPKVLPAAPPRALDVVETYEYFPPGDGLPFTVMGQLSAAADFYDAGLISKDVLRQLVDAA